MKNKKELYIIFLLITVSIIIFLPSSYQSNFYYSLFGDFNGHLNYVKEIQSGDPVSFSHLLYHYLVIGIVNVLKILPQLNFSERIINTSSLIVVLFFQVITVLLIYIYIYSEVSETQNNKVVLISFLVSIALSLIGPITIFSWFLSENILLGTYIGYLMPTIFHNPTYILLRPLSLIVFLYSLKFIFIQKIYISINLRLITPILLAILVVLNGFSKPNFLISFIPVIIIYTLFQKMQKKFINISFALGGLLIPGTIILLYHFFQNEGISNQLQFSPLTSLAYWDPEFYKIWFIPKIIFSLLFPAAVSIFYFNEVLNNLYIKVAWMNLAIALFLMYSFVEGNRIHHWNFAWGGYIAAFILFVVSTAFFISHHLLNNKVLSNLPDKISFYTCVLIFGLHLATNLPWFVINSFHFLL